MEPKSQVEIQLGHMCNNRCVFCVSGQRTALGQALPLSAEPLLAEVRRAYTNGQRKLTLLGGEPTLQPAFMEVVREAVALGFEEIVIFTNGAKTARESFIDEILATGGRFTFRFSVQGATRESHETTTRKPGSFDRIVRSMGHVAARGVPITVNLCVVASNYESVDAFPALLLPFGARQLHLDMLRPLDAGERTDAEMRAMLPRYSLLAEPFRRMVRGFPEGFDVNIGNLPYCVAPDLAPWIHHDGEHTLTISIEGDEQLSKPWDKYFTKRRDKFKPAPCAACVFEPRCSGVFETYAEVHGVDELVPITRARFREVDPTLRLFSTHASALLRELEWTPPAPFTRWTALERGADQVDVHVHTASSAGSPAAVFELTKPSKNLGTVRFDLFDATPRWLSNEVSRELTNALAASFQSACARADAKLIVPFQDGDPAPASTVVARLSRLSAAAPFGALAWTATALTQSGHRAELTFSSPHGESVVLWLAESQRKPSGGYTLQDKTREPSPELLDGLRAIVSTLAGTRSATTGARPSSP